MFNSLFCSATLAKAIFVFTYPMEVMVQSTMALSPTYSFGNLKKIRHIVRTTSIHVAQRGFNISHTNLGKNGTGKNGNEKNGNGKNGTVKIRAL